MTFIRAEEIKKILAGELEFDESTCIFEVETLSPSLSQQINQLEAELDKKTR